MYVRIGPQRKLGVEELMLLNCGAREDSWESLDSKEMKPVNPKGNQSWTFIGRTDTEAKAPILWPPNGKFQHIGKDPDAGKDWRQEKRATEDGIDGWHPRLNGQEFDQTLGDSEGPGSLACCSLWCQKKVDLPEQQQSFLLMLIVKSHKNRSKLNPSRTLWGSWARRPMSPISCREQTPACVILPEFQRADLNRCWSGKGWGGEAGPREEQPRNKGGTAQKQ